MVGLMLEVRAVDLRDVINAMRKQAEEDMRAAYQRWGRDAFPPETPGRAREPQGRRMTLALREAVEILRESGPMTASEMADSLLITEAAARTRIRDLRRIGEVEVAEWGYPRRYMAMLRG